MQFKQSNPFIASNNPTVLTTPMPCSLLTPSNPLDREAMQNSNVPLDNIYNTINTLLPNAMMQIQQIIIMIPRRVKL